MRYEVVNKPYHDMKWNVVVYYELHKQVIAKFLHRGDAEAFANMKCNFQLISKAVKEKSNEVQNSD